MDSEIEIKAYYAGHVLGAAMFHVRVGDQSVVYTVSWSWLGDQSVVYTVSWSWLGDQSVVYTVSWSWLGEFPASRTGDPGPYCGECCD